MFGSFGVIFLCGTNSNIDDQPGYATVVSQLEDHQPDMVFQQDGAPPHGARNAREFLEMHFPGRWVGCDGPIPWSPRSPDITPLAFFLWGYVKDIVYKIPMTSFDELKLRIVAAIETATPQIAGEHLERN
jgi:hypothetical protein